MDDAGLVNALLPYTGHKHGCATMYAAGFFHGIHTTSPMRCDCGYQEVLARVFDTQPVAVDVVGGTVIHTPPTREE